MTTTELTERREHARSATALEFEVDGADALDAFNHPFAYAAGDSGHIATPHGVTS